MIAFFVQFHAETRIRGSLEWRQARFLLLALERFADIPFIFMKNININHDDDDDGAVFFPNYFPREL